MTQIPNGAVGKLTRNGQKVVKKRGPKMGQKG